MSVVDLFRIYRNQFPTKFNETSVLDFSEELCANLRERENQRDRYLTSLARPRFRGGEEDVPSLSRITDENGDTTREPTLSQKTKHGRRRTGSALHDNCFICRRFIGPHGKPTYHTTIFWCSLCHMPICRKDRRDKSRKLTCLEHHQTTTDTKFSCGELHRRQKLAPDDMIPYNPPKESEQLEDSEDSSWKQSESQPESESEYSFHESDWESHENSTDDDEESGNE